MLQWFLSLLQLDAKLLQKVNYLRANCIFLQCDDFLSSNFEHAKKHL